MKTTIDIPDKELLAAMKFTKASTKREAVVSAISDFNRRKRMALLARHLNSCRNMMTPDELKKMRETD